MALKFAERVRETTSTTGTGTYSLSGAVPGFQTFVAGIGTGHSCYYMVTDNTDWEVGRGTVTDANPDTLSRDSILDSSNSGSAVNWGSGSKKVILTKPSPYASGDLVFLAEQTASGGSTLDFTSGIDDTFSTYEVHYGDYYPNASGSFLSLRFSDNGGSTWDTGTNYSYLLFHTNFVDAPSQSFSSAAADRLWIARTSPNGSPTGNSSNGVIQFWNLRSTAQWKSVQIRALSYMQTAGTVPYNMLAGGVWKSTNAVNGIRFLDTGSGTLANGWFRLYGVRS